MRIRTSKSSKGRRFYIIKTYYDSKGVEHTVTVEKLGSEHEIREKYNCDPDEWVKKRLDELNRQEAEQKKDITVTFPSDSLITKNHRYEFQVGYLFLQKIYHELGLDRICRSISSRYSFTYDLNSVLSRLIYERILNPSSKSATFTASKALLEPPAFEEHHMYRALDILAEESDYIQSSLYSNSFALGKRNTGVIYYDCTNFFFEVEDVDEDDIRQYGKSKENRPLPLVEMGMFIDSDGIPLSVCINPGNTNEQITLRPLEKKIISDFGLSKFVVCTDAGLASKANRRFNTLGERSFITVQSVKKLKKELKEWALSPSGWHISGQGGKKTCDISLLDSEKYRDTVFYKERWVDQNTFEEKLIVTFSFRYRDYQQHIREGQIQRAKAAIENGSAKLRKRNQNDYRRFIEKTSATEDGEIAEKHTYSLNQDAIDEEKKYDGFYAVVSNLDDSVEQIIAANSYRWKIEECFRIMKSEFEARPAYVRKNNRIEAHFLTCFLALTVFRYLEKRLGYKYTCEQIIDTLREMRVREVMGEGYIPCYERTDLTDELHEKFQFRTDYNITTRSEMKKIIKKTKTKK